MTTTTVTSTSTDSNPPPYEGMAADLRRHIIHGTIPPGAMLKADDITRRYGISGAGVKILSALKGEQVVTWHLYKWYATPAGPPDPETGARLGATLARMREAAGLTPEDIENTDRWLWPDEVREAEAGAWQPRKFWERADAALGADGTLLKLHDNYYAGPGPGPGDPHPGPWQVPEPGPPGPPSPPPDSSRVAAEFAARLTAGEWPPGARLPSQSSIAHDHGANQTAVGYAMRQLAGQGLIIRTSYGYFTPGTRAHEAPVSRTLAAVVLEWNDGTRTRLACTPAVDPATP